MPNDNDNKLVTLADLGEAYNTLYARDVMDASDKTKLDGIEAGAQVNTVTSVNNQTGAVSLTPADIEAVAKSGDTMTGQLTIDISAQGDQGRILFASPGVSGKCQLIANTTGTQQRITFRQFVSDGTSFEEYALPNTADYTGGPVLRNILTDKSPITIGQGGTGATTPAGARNNLGIYPFHLSNVNIDSNGQGFINFSTIGLSSRPIACFMETINVGNTTIRYNYHASTSQIVLEPLWVDMKPITNTAIEIQGVAFT